MKERTSKKNHAEMKPAAITQAKRKLWLFRIVAASLPVLLFVMIELILRLVGYGYTTAFFSELSASDGKKYFINSETFSLRFFPPRLARWPGPFRIAAEKPADTKRMFVLGESAAMGDPQPAYGASRYLEVLLRERFPHEKFEVVNLGITAINSHVILPIAREVASRGQGDLWIIYMGNNEMVGPFGAATVFGSRAPPLWMVRFNLAVQQSRVGQLAMSLLRQTRGKSDDPVAWSGMKMFLQNQIAVTDSRRVTVYQNFERNLRDILSAGTKSGAKLVLSTMAVNLRDCPPFASMVESNRPPVELEEFRECYAKALALEAQANHAEAVHYFERAGKLSPSFAELHFRWGACLDRMDQKAQAQEQFQLACDNDALPFRANTRINAIIRKLAKECAADALIFCDAEADLMRASPVGTAGDESFFEHVHFNFDGNYRLALSWAEQVAPALGCKSVGNNQRAWATQEECERLLGLTDFNRAYVLQMVMQRMAQPPLSSQYNNPQRLQRLQAAEAELQNKLQQPGAFAIAREMFRRALDQAPDDHYLYEGLGNLLESMEDQRGASAAYRKSLEKQPQDFYSRLRLGHLLGLQGLYHEAGEMLLQAARIRPSLPEAWYELASVQVLAGDFRTAMEHFDLACELRPNDPASKSYRSHCRGKWLAQQDRHAEAVAQYRQAIEELPQNWEAHFELGGELDAANQLDAAQKAFADAVRLKPNYSRTHFNHGVLLAKLGRFEEAQREFEQTLRLEPGNTAAREYLEQAQSLQLQKR